MYLGSHRRRRTKSGTGPERLECSSSPCFIILYSYVMRLGRAYELPHTL